MRANQPLEVRGKGSHDQFLKKRIDLVEKHFSNLCSAFGGYTRKTAALRDKSDELAVAVHNFAETEDVNTSLRSGLENFASTLCSIGDYRDAEVRRLESRVVGELSQYQGLCKGAREVLKSTLAARGAEVARKRYFTRLRESNPRLKQQIVHAESEAAKASAEVARTSVTLKQQTDKFEEKKLHDLRAVLLDFVTVELSFNTKVIELYTKIYNDILGVNEEEDFKDFRRALNVAETESTSRLDSLKKAPSLNNNSRFLSNVLPMSFLFKRPDFATRVNQPFGMLKHNSSSKAQDSKSSTNHGGSDVEDSTLSERFVRSPGMSQPSVKHPDARGKSYMGITSGPLTICDADDSSDRFVNSPSVEKLFAKLQESKDSSPVKNIASRSIAGDGKVDFLLDYSYRPALKVRKNSERLRDNIGKSSPMFGPDSSTTGSGDDAEDKLFIPGRFKSLGNPRGDLLYRRISKSDRS